MAAARLQIGDHAVSHRHGRHGDLVGRDDPGVGDDSLLGDDLGVVMAHMITLLPGSHEPPLRHLLRALRGLAAVAYRQPVAGARRGARCPARPAGSARLQRGTGQGADAVSAAVRVPCHVEAAVSPGGGGVGGAALRRARSVLPQRACRICAARAGGGVAVRVPGVASDRPQRSAACAGRRLRDGVRPLPAAGRGRASSRAGAAPASASVRMRCSCASAIPMSWTSSAFT